MELDKAKVKDMAFQLFALMDSCRFFGYHLTKDKDRLRGNTQSTKFIQQVTIKPCDMTQTN